jgi:DNA mismatch repair protein MutS
MVEMTETAAILHKATSRSLVILDEIGRGTSTYDGISLAWSIAEYLLNTPNKQAKTLFATHYFELTRLEQRFPKAVNYNVAVLEEGDHVVFLRKIIRGSADRSYGIHVARLAGLPAPVLKRAQEILHLLEDKERQPAPKGKKAPSAKAPSREVQILLNF